MFIWNQYVTNSSNCKCICKILTIGIKIISINKRETTSQYPSTGNWSNPVASSNSGCFQPYKVSPT